MTEETIEEYAKGLVERSSCKTQAEKEYYYAGALLGAEWQQKIDEEEQGKALLYAVHKTTERTKKEMMEKACEWLRNNLGYYDRHEVHIGKSYEEVVIDDFRKALEE